MYTSLDSMGKVSLMMDLISQRQRALGSNIANVHTPGYIRQDIEFGQYLSTMNSPLETRLSEKLGPSAIATDRSEEPVKRAFENSGKLNPVFNGNKKNVKHSYRNENRDKCR